MKNGQAHAGVMDGRGAADGLEKAAGLLSLAAGAVHGIVTPEHFREWWGYGAFFLVAGLVQAVFGIALITGTINEQDAGPRWRDWKRRLYGAGVVGTLAIIALYGVTRTTGIPWFGPEAGVVEDVAPIDVVSKGLELALVIVLVVMLRRTARPSRESLTA